MRYPNFVGPSYVSQSRLADAEDLINWCVVTIASQGSKVRQALYPTPGVVSRFTLPQTPIRSLFFQEGRGFVIGGGKLKEFFQDYSTQERGDVTQDGNPGTMTTNGDGGGELLVTSGNAPYVLDLGTNVLTPLKDIAGAAFVGAMLNGRFLILDVQESKLSCSDPFDGLTWNAFAFTQRSTASDPWRMMLVSTSTSKVYMLGELTSDVYYDVGTTPFPLAPITGALIPWGISAPFSAVDYRGRIMWLAQNKDGDRVVVALTGYSTADAISNEALESALATYERIDDAEGFVYEELGRTYYVLNFPSADASWAFDDAGGWHKRGTWNINTGRYDVWRARCHALAFGKHLVGDRLSGGIYEMSSNFGFDFAGAPLRRVRRMPGLQSELERIFYPGLRLYIENGLGLIIGQGSNPKVLYRYSDDGGKTWGGFREASAGKQGDYKTHIDFLMNGSANDRVDEIIVSDPIPWRVMDAFLLGMGGGE